MDKDMLQLFYVVDRAIQIGYRFAEHRNVFYMLLEVALSVAIYYLSLR